jgi:hypothetical protein
VTAARRPWSPDRVRKLARDEVAVNVEVAAEILGIPRSTAYALAARGEFPVPVIKVSRRRWIVPTAHILTALGLDESSGEVRLRAVP